MYSLFNAISSIHLRPENKTEPLGPMYIDKSGRSAIPDDFNNETIQALSDYVEEINDPELKSRIADIVWLRLKNPKMAEIAINAYLDSAVSLEDPEHWPKFTDRVERALRLSALFRRQNKALFNSVIDTIENTIKKYSGKDPLFLSIRLMELLDEFTSQKDDQYYKLSIQIGLDAKSDKNWHKAENAWGIAEKWAKQLKDIERQNYTLTQLAETFVEQAGLQDSSFNSSHWLQKSIEVYKKIPDSKEIREVIYKKLREQQVKSNEEMSTIELDAIDISEIVVQSENLVKNLNLKDALISFAFKMLKPIDYEESEKKAIKDSKRFIGHHLFGSIYTNGEGLIEAHVPPSVGTSSDATQRNIRASMFRSAQITHGLAVQAQIEPARHQIQLEHHINEKSILSIFQHNPLIRPGHEYLFLKGILSGFEGDFVTCIHILIPQIECSFRYLLEQHGIETTTLNPHGVQEHLRLGAIFNEPKFEEIIGKDILMEFQGLLTDKLYANLRNEISHGLISTERCFSAPVIYCWWLAFRLCLTPFYKSMLPKDIKETKEDSPISK